MICEKCGTELRVGDFPFCPHGRAVNNVIGDDIPGGFVQENFGDKAEVFYSKKDMARRAKELGLVEFVRWAGPHDKYVRRWDAPDQYTLDAAKALVERM